MKFWQAVSMTELDQLPEIARFAEEVGFFGLSISDHLVIPEKILTPYPYTEDGQVWWDPKAPFPDPWATATWLGAITERLQFMSYVYILGLRDPFTVAKLLGTAASLTNDRIQLGMGVGWMKDEFDMVGQSFENRGRRADEMLTVIRSLLKGEMASFEGEFFSYPPVQMSPVPSMPIPVLVGGNSRAAMRRAARNDGWLGIFIDPDDVSAQLAQIDQYREEQGTLGKPFDLLVVPNGEQTPDLYRRLADLGVTSGVNPPWYFTSSPTSSIDVKKADMERFAKEFIEPLSSYGP